MDLALTFMLGWHCWLAAKEAHHRGNSWGISAIEPRC